MLEELNLKVSLMEEKVHIAIVSLATHTSLHQYLAQLHT